MTSPLPVSSSEIQDLILALNRLSLAVESHSASSVASAGSDRVLPDQWILVEESEPLPAGYSDSRVCRSVEDGPGATPQALVSLGKHRLTGVDPGYETRVRRAFVAGFWAWAASATNTEYQPADPIPLPDTQYIVLRSWTIDPKKVKLPARVKTKSDLIQLIGPLPAPGAIVQGFSSLTEVQIFCGGANIPIPPLLQWRPSRTA